MKATPKQRIIYATDHYENFEAIKIFLIEDHCSEYPGDEDWEPTDDRVWTELEFRKEDAWDIFEQELENFIQDKTFILQGSVGTWCGRSKGGFVFNTFNELSQAWRGCDYIKCYDENGHMYLECSHHDGTNYLEIRQLTPAGMQYLERHECDDLEKLHDKLMGNPYSVRPEFAHKVYGCKRREFVIE
jgi:hypothetical protein